MWFYTAVSYNVGPYDRPYDSCVLKTYFSVHHIYKNVKPLLLMCEKGCKSSTAFVLELSRM